MGHTLRTLEKCSLPSQLLFASVARDRSSQFGAQPPIRNVRAPVAIEAKLDNSGAGLALLHCSTGQRRTLACASDQL